PRLDSVRVGRGRAARPRRAGASENLPVLDEARPLGDLVVEGARVAIVLLRQPMDAARALGARRLLDGGDERPADAMASGLGGNEQVLQIAVVAGRPAGAVEDDVSDAGEAFIDEGAEDVHRLGR